MHIVFFFNVKQIHQPFSKKKKKCYKKQNKKEIQNLITSHIWLLPTIER